MEADGGDISPTTLDAVFAPLEDGNRASAVSRRLARAIELGHLPAGTRLPTEMQLAAQFSVSTITLREALATLRRDGLVSTRRGRGAGTFVEGPSATTVARLETLVRGLAVDDIRDLGDLCQAVRGAAAKLAAERAGDEDVSRLRDRLATVEGVRERLGWRREDGRFHAEIASASHSTRLARVEIGMQEEAATLLLLPAFDAKHRPATVRRYRALLAAIEDGDGTAARDLAEAHVAVTIDHLIDVHLKVAGR